MENKEDLDMEIFFAYAAGFLTGMGLTVGMVWVLAWQQKKGE